MANSCLNLAIVFPKELFKLEQTQVLDILYVAFAFAWEILSKYHQFLSGVDSQQIDIIHCFSF